MVDDTEIVEKRKHRMPHQIVQDSIEDILNNDVIDEHDKDRLLMLPKYELRRDKERAYKAHKGDY